MNRSLVLIALVAGSAVSVSATAQTPSSPSPPPGSAQPMRPSALPPVIRPEPVTVDRPPAAPGDSADAGRWKGARSVKISAGEADVRLSDGSSLHLRPGDAVGPDTVDRIEAGRILLSRRAPDSAATAPRLATVVVTFDGSGAARTRVYWLEDAKAVPPPLVK
jgi:hypothetical protein